MKRFLVGLDGSPLSSEVLAAAIELARDCKAKIVLARVVGIPSELPSDIWKLDTPSLTVHLREQAAKYLRSCSDVVPRDVLDITTPCIVEVGVPWDGMCSIARDVHADVIVIGSHGYGGIDRLLGTTAAKIVNHAPCAVHVIRATEKKAVS